MATEAPAAEAPAEEKKKKPILLIILGVVGVIVIAVGVAFGTLYLSGYYAMMQGEEPPTDGYKVGGCGMDMGFHLVYTLSSLLYKKDRGGYELRHEWL